MVLYTIWHRHAAQPNYERAQYNSSLPPRAAGQEWLLRQPHLMVRIGRVSFMRYVHKVEGGGQSWTSDSFGGPVIDINTVREPEPFVPNPNPYLGYKIFGDPD